MENYATEKELEDIVHQMGQNIRSGAQLAKLTNEINRYLNEESYLSEADEDVLNESLFASLSIDPAAQFMRKGQIYPSENMNIQSPIVSRMRRGKNSVYENIEFHNEFDENSTRENLEAKSLIDQAWRSIHRAYETCRGATEVIDRMSFEHSVEHEMSDEEVDGEDIAESVSVSVNSGSNSSNVQKPIAIIIDPSVRPVRSPKPGRVPYKFDPVTRYHLYKTEWERHPAPGELRRLSLRWKVREFMLRHDVPRLTVNPEGKVNHEKDWSPRPYMN